MYLVSQYQKSASGGISRPSRPFSEKMASDGMRAGGPPDTQPYFRPAACPLRDMRVERLGAAVSLKAGFF
jgi:hypothetical protein